jgi:hypothetical protein
LNLPSHQRPSPSRPRRHAQEPAALLDEQDALDRERGVRALHIPALERLHEQREHAEQLRLRQLVPERVQEAQRVRLQHRLRAPAELRVHVRAEEADHVDERVRRRHALLCVRQRV